MFQLLQRLFSEKLETDTRAAAVTFHVTNKFMNSFLCRLFNVTGHTCDHFGFGLVLPSTSFYLQQGIIIFIQCILSIICAATVYYFIVQKRNTTQAFFVGFGIIIPFVIYMPYWFIRLLDLRNNCLAFVISSTPVLVMFRCLEAMYGTSPVNVESSIATYMIYYSSMAQFEFDPKARAFVRITRKIMMQSFVTYLKSTFLAGLLFSILHPRSYMLFKEDFIQNDFVNFPLLRLFHWKHLLNNFSLALLLYHCLLSCTTIIGIISSSLTGIQTLHLMNDPLFSSSSPLDFWSRRWNIIIHQLLKRGVYIPIRKYYSSVYAPMLGLVMTFAVSGLFHEYLLHVFSIKCRLDAMNYDGMKTSCVPSGLGNHLAFFLWNAIVIVVQIQLQKFKMCQQFAQSLPSCISTLITLMTVLPISHWFVNDYLSTSLISDMKLVFPMIVQTQ